MRRSTKARLTEMVNTFFLSHLLRLLYRPYIWRTRARGETPTTDFVNDPTFESPSGLALHTKVIQSYYDLAHRLRHLLPPTCSWLESGDVQIVDAIAFSSGGFAEVWKGSVQGLSVVVKSLRCYSDPGFDSAELGIVSLHRSAQIDQHSQHTHSGSSGRSGQPHSFHTRILFRSWAYTVPPVTHLLSFTK